MMKILLLISTLFILSNCATSNPNSESAEVNSTAVSAQANATPELAQAGADSESAANDDKLKSDEPGNNPDAVEPDGDIEVVEVEGKKEQHCTTRAVTGSRIPTRYCRSAVQYEREKEASKHFIRNIKLKPQGLTLDQKG